MSILAFSSHVKSNRGHVIYTPIRSFLCGGLTTVRISLIPQNVLGSSVHFFRVSRQRADGIAPTVPVRKKYIRKILSDHFVDREVVSVFSFWWFIFLSCPDASSNN